MTPLDVQNDRLESADVDFLRRLHRLESATIQQLCDELSVTATAVRYRLTRLTVAGYITRRTVKTNRGRPRHEYALTNQGQRELGDNYFELAHILWKEVSQIDDESVRNLLVGRIQQAFISRYGEGVEGETLAVRLDQLRKKLQEHGLDVEVDESGDLPVLRENSCPYYDLAASDIDICELEQRVFERVLGSRMDLVQRCVEGHSCCEFHIRDEKLMHNDSTGDVPARCGNKER